MVLLRHMTPWHMPDTVIALYTIPPFGLANASTLPLYLPMLMPHISFGPPLVWSMGLSKSCFCNDSSCMPVVSSTISAQNHLVIPHHDDHEFRHTWLAYGAQIEVDSLNGDEKILKISNRRDPSFDLP